MSIFLLSNAPFYTNEAQRSEVICPRSSSWEVLEPQSKASFVESQLLKCVVARFPDPLTLTQLLLRISYLKAHMYHFSIFLSTFK